MVIHSRIFDFFICKPNKSLHIIQPLLQLIVFCPDFLHFFFNYLILNHVSLKVSVCKHFSVVLARLLFHLTLESPLVKGQQDKLQDARQYEQTSNFCEDSLHSLRSEIYHIYIIIY